MSLKTSATLKTRIHDGIVGVMVLTGSTLGLTQGPVWLYATAALGGLMISSTFTGFCPVYFILDRIMGNAETQAG
jgi:hypothetical protein